MFGDVAVISQTIVFDEHTTHRWTNYFNGYYVQALRYLPCFPPLLESQAAVMAPETGATLIASALRNLGVTVIFGIVGIPVVEIAEEAINLGIRFIGFRNEQAASYAASAYGYLTGRPGVCLVVGGPGVLHAISGVSYAL